MLKKTLLWSMLAALVIVLAACGSKNNDEPASNTGGVEETGAAAQEVIIKASNWEFDQPEYTIKKGEPVKITLETTEGMHGIEFADLDIDKLIAGDSEVVTINDAGTYEFHCNIQCGTGHAKMVGKLVVK